MANNAKFGHTENNCPQEPLRFVSKPALKSFQFHLIRIPGFDSGAEEKEARSC